MLLLHQVTRDIRVVYRIWINKISFLGNNRVEDIEKVKA